MNKQTILVSTLMLSVLLARAEEQETIYLFGKKPVQVNVGKDGSVTTERGGGFRCDLKASLGSDKYSEWGKTEDDAREIVYQKCKDKSGVLICKKDRVTCKASDT